MRPIYVIGIVLSISLIYLSIFGLAGFGFPLQLTGTIYRQDFNSMDGWAVHYGTAKINPAGQLEMNSPAGTGTARRCALNTLAGSLQLPATYTVEFKMIIDRMPSDGVQEVGIYDDTYWIPFDIYTDHVKTGTKSFSVNVGNQWHVWMLVCDHTAATNKFDVYMDKQKLTSMDYIPSPDLQGQGKLSLDGFGGAEIDTLTHFDYIYIDSGLLSPSGGRILAHCSQSGNPVQGASVQVPGSGSATSGTDGIAIISSVPAGTYTVTATYSGVTRTNPGVIVIAGQDTDIFFDFSSNPSGTIMVNAKDVNGKTITVTVSLTGPTAGSHDTPWTFSSLAYGSYTVSGTWKGETKTGSATLTSSSPSASITLQYSQADTGGEFPNILLLVNNLIIKYSQPIMILGALGTLISSIMFVLPAKKVYAPAPHLAY